MQIKVLSWNIWCDGDFPKISEFLRSSDADIIGLQEVIRDDKERDIVNLLSNLGYEHAVAQSGVELPDGRVITNAVFSKYPIQKSKMHMLSEKSSRQAVETEIKVGDVTLNAFSLHTKHTHQKESDIQNLQVENFIKVLPKEKVVVMGDFNATPDMTSVKRMREILIDTDPSSSPTWSVYSEGCNTCKPQAIDTRLDYIFTSKDLKTHSFKVGDSKASDHLPISVIVEV